MIKKFIRAFYKLIIGPIIYKRQDGYDAKRYWSRRLSRYGTSMQGIGNEGLDEKQNSVLYKESKNAFLKTCDNLDINFNTIRVLDVGCGIGYYTRLLRNKGVKHYTGIDITDVPFPKLRSEFIDYIFIEKDVTRENILGEYDFIFVIDVLEHIVTEEKLCFALQNMSNALSYGGYIIISPVMPRPKKKFFYLRLWDMNTMLRYLHGFSIVSIMPLRGCQMVCIHKNNI